MAKFTPYALSALPTNGIDVNGLYFIKEASSSSFNVYLRKSDNSDWVPLGTTTETVEKVNGLTGAVKLDLDFTNGKLKVSATGTGTAVAITEIDLDARYRKISDSVAWADITGVPAFALDSAVVHKTGTETITGSKTFSSNVTIPAVPSADAHAASKKYVDDADAVIQNQVNSLETIVNNGVRVPLPLNCSTNPNYPAATKGDQYRVTGAGKIGGASGVAVEINDTIVCIETNSGGTHASVGAKFYILQANVDQATETVSGLAKIATQAQTNAGTDDKTIVTPKKLQSKLDAAMLAAELEWGGTNGKEW